MTEEEESVRWPDLGVDVSSQSRREKEQRVLGFLEQIHSGFEPLENSVMIFGQSWIRWLRVRWHMVLQWLCVVIPETHVWWLGDSRDQDRVSNVKLIFIRVMSFLKLFVFKTYVICL